MLKVLSTLLALMIFTAPVWAGDDEKDLWDIEKDELLVASVQRPAWNASASFKKLLFITFEQAVTDRDGLYRPKVDWGASVTAGVAQGLWDETQPYGIDLQIADPEVVTKTINEKGLTGAGLGNEAAAVQLGQNLQAQVVVYGRVGINIQTVGEKGQAYWVCPAKSGKGVEVRSLKCLIRTITVSLTMKFVNVANGQCLFLYDKGFAQTSELQPKLFVTEDAQAESEVVQELLRQLVKDVLVQITPQDTFRVMKTEDGKSKPAKEARNYMLLGDLGRAIPLLREGIAIKSDDHGAWYNLGLAYEITGYLTEARKAYERAYWIKDKDRYFEAIRRLDAQLEAAKPAVCPGPAPSQTPNPSQGQAPAQQQTPQAPAAISQPASSPQTVPLPMAPSVR
jgi:hypothetical protein